MTWVLLAILAAAFQTLRFLLQKVLAMGALTAAGSTYARFLYSAPFVSGLALAYLVFRGDGFPGLSARFWLFALLGGFFQILGTWAVVALFARRAFAVGITFKKTEVIQAALVGFVLLGDRVSLAGFAAIVLGLIGVLVLSARPGTRGAGSLLNKGAGLGLLSGAVFALSAVAYRGAVLEIASQDALLRALVTLAVVTLSQTLAVTLWLRLREPGEISRVLRVWPQAVWLGLAGMAGSLCWFAAFSLQNAAYVFAVGQIEVIFSLAVSILVFGERLARRELLGITLLTASILALVLVA
ncbi:MAG TPA: DMT family transporter [Aliiroseovarius sp.]|nr:DMT family transporter [Aliiroseovarius sp.]